MIIIILTQILQVIKLHMMFQYPHTDLIEDDQDKQKMFKNILKTKTTKEDPEDDKDKQMMIPESTKDEDYRRWSRR